MRVFNKARIVALFIPFTFYAMTVDEMAQQTLDTNPQLKKYISELRSMEYDLDKAYSGYKPSVDLYGGVGPQKTHRQGSGVNTQTDLVATEASLTLTENLFNGYNDEYNVKEQKSRIEAAKYFTLQEANSILIKFITSYLNIIRYKQILEIEHANMTTHERINRMIRRKTELGHGNKTDVEQSEARKVLAYSNYVVQQNNYRDALYNFERYYGEVLFADQMQGAFNADLPSYNFDELIGLALQHNPTIKVEEFNIKTQDNKYAKTLSSFYPTLDAEVSLDYTNDTDGYEYDKRSAKAMLKLNYNLYKGGYDESIRLQNLEAKNAHQYSYQENQRAVIEKLRLAFISYLHNKNRIKCLEVYIKLSKSTAESYAEEYHFGRRTLLDLLNVEQEYTHAQKELINAKHELFLSTYRVLDALGVTASALHTDLYDVLQLEKPDLQQPILSDQTVLKDLRDDTTFIDMDSACAEPAELDLEIVENVIKQSQREDTLEKAQTQKNMTQGIIIDETNPEDVKIELIGIHFEFNSAILSEESKMNIASLAKKVLEKKNVIMEVHGHTDNIGSYANNKKVSVARAQSAKNELVRNGVNADIIQIFGHAFDKPVATNETEEGRALNRRIEFIIKNEDTQP